MYAVVKKSLTVMVDKASMENNIVKNHGGIFAFEDTGKYTVIIDRSTIVNTIAQMGSGSVVYSSSTTDNVDV